MDVEREIERQVSRSSARNTFDVLARKFRNLDNVHRFGLNNGKFHRRVKKKANSREIYVVLNLDKRGNVLPPPGFDDEGEAPDQEQGPAQTA